MYTRQIIGAVGISGIVGFWLLNIGSSALVVGAGSVTTYYLVRWIWATFHRTRYWLPTGTKGTYSERCPNCRSGRHRMSGDWLLECKKCGWKPGLPVLRWLYRSVPAVQFRRSVSKIGAFAVGASTTVLLSSRPETAGGPPLSLPDVTLALPGLPGEGEIVLFISAIVVVVGVLLWMMQPRQYYCKKCGQDLGKGDPPEVCPKCGSNRFTNQDPGVAQKIELK